MTDIESINQLLTELGAFSRNVIYLHSAGGHYQRVARENESLVRRLRNERNHYQRVARENASIIHRLRLQRNALQQLRDMLIARLRAISRATGESG